jgi:glycosyltransferase involved in cell wall biosynthesis
MNISVVVCTYNRAHSLERTLQSIAQQKLPDDFSWEVIVVDNNSSDSTSQVIQDAQERLKISNLRYEFEGKQGLSHARNHGISCANGQIILFTDDDVCPESDWVYQIANNMDRYKCEACGGRIAPVWEEAPPKWLSERLYGFLALRMENGRPRQITDAADVPFGANMAFYKSVFDRVGMFDASRGRKGNMLAGGEELDVFGRILDNGGKIYYFPAARVHHYIESFRAKKSYFRRWRFQGSKNIAETEGIQGQRRIMGIPPYIFVQLIRAVYKAAVGKITLPPDEAFLKEIIVWHFLGLIAGLYRQQSEPGFPRKTTDEF